MVTIKTPPPEVTNYLSKHMFVDFVAESTQRHSQWVVVDSASSFLGR